MSRANVASQAFRALEERLESQERQLERLFAMVSELDAKVTSLLSRQDSGHQQLADSVHRLERQVNRLQTAKKLCTIWTGFDDLADLENFRIESGFDRLEYGPVEGIDNRSQKPVRISVWDTESEAPFTRTVFLQSQLGVEGIARVIGWGVIPRYTGPRIVSVEEFGDYGSLDSLIQNCRKGTFPKGASVTTLSTAILGVAATMSQLHGLHLVHRFLKATCIAVTSRGEPLFCDFGEARYLDEDWFSCTRKFPWDWYCAPEVDNDGPAVAREDVFAFGTLMFYLFSDQPEFLGDVECRRNSEFRLTRAIERGARFARSPAIPDQFWRLIEYCWVESHDDDQSFTNIVQEMLRSTHYALPGTDMREYQGYQNQIKRRLEAPLPEESFTARTRIDTLTFSASRPH
jgi:serine/threonine protein kinase